MNLYYGHNTCFALEARRVDIKSCKYQIPNRHNCPPPKSPAQNPKTGEEPCRQSADRAMFSTRSNLIALFRALIKGRDGEGAMRTTNNEQAPDNTQPPNGQHRSAPWTLATAVEAAAAAAALRITAAPLRHTSKSKVLQAQARKTTTTQQSPTKQ